MNRLYQSGRDVPGNQILAAVTAARNRRILRFLSDEAGSVEIADLARHIARVETDAPDEVPTSAVERRQVALYHVHLPALEGADLVDWDRDAGVVGVTDHAVFDDSAFVRLLELDAEFDHVLESLADGRRRAVLAVLEDADEPMTEYELARQVAARETEDADPDTALVDELLVEFHHVHLPKLEDAGLVEYRGGGVTATDLADEPLDANWTERLAREPVTP